MRKSMLSFALLLSFAFAFAVSALAQQAPAGEAWWFFHKDTSRSGHSLVVGPFRDKDSCETIAKQSVRDKIFYHVTDCWLGPIVPVTIGR